MPTTDEMKIIRPRRARTMPDAARFATRYVPARFVSTTVVKSASLMRSSSPSFVMPAFATSTSTGPKRSSTAANVASTSDVLVTSQRSEKRSSGGGFVAYVTATRCPSASNAARARETDAA